MSSRDLAELSPLPTDPSKRYGWVPGEGWQEIPPAPEPAPPYASVVTKAGTSQTAILADAGRYVRFTSTSATTYTVVPQASVAWPDDAEITIRRAANANLTLAAGSGVTLNAPSGGTLVLTNNMTVTLKRVTANVWDVIGQTVAA